MPGIWMSSRLIREHALALLGEVLTGRFRMLEPLLELLLLPLAMHVLLLLMAVAFPFAPVRLYGLAGLTLVLLHVLAGVLVAGGGWRDVAAWLPRHSTWHGRCS
jgi:hypothetical protein